MISYETEGQTQEQLVSPFVAAAVLNPSRWLTLSLVNLIIFGYTQQKNKKGPTYGPNSDEEWS